MLHVAMTIAYGKLRHLCDDPVCPDPVWKPSRRASGGWALPAASIPGARQGCDDSGAEFGGLAKLPPLRASHTCPRGPLDRT